VCVCVCVCAFLSKYVTLVAGADDGDDDDDDVQKPSVIYFSRESIVTDKMRRKRAEDC